jgi:alpha-L-arabinofuranosidase
MKKLFLSLIFLLLSINILSAQDDVLRVDASESWGAISPYVYGASYGPWALVNPDMWPLAEDSGITLFRFPGGNWGDQFDIRPDQLDLFMLQARNWGAEPSVSVRVIGGSPEKSAELVRYANIEKDYNIRYWTIGNEPTLYLDDGYTLDSFNQVWREHAEAMLEVDPDIIFIGPEVHQYAFNEEPNNYLYEMRRWVRGFLEVNGDMVDIVSIHRYPFPLTNTSSATIDDLRQNARQIDDVINILKKDIQEILGHDMPIAVTEINSHWSNTAGGEASPDSFYNAIWWADVLGRMIRQKVEVVSYFALAASPGSGLGMMTSFKARPTYYVYQIYQRFGQELVAAESADPDLTIYAARRDDGALTLVVINLGAEEATRTLELEGFTPSGDADVLLFDAEHNAESVDPVAITDGGAITVPGQSITLYTIPGSN